MVRFGFYLGAAFQIQDDLLNLLGTEREYGKEIDGDLYEGKRTLPLIHLLRNARGADRQTLDRYLGLERSRAHRRDGRGGPAAHGRLREHRVRGGLRARHRRRRARRLRGGLRAGHPGPDRDFVRALVPYMLDRRA